HLPGHATLGVDTEFFEGTQDHTRHIRPDGQAGEVPVTLFEFPPGVLGVYGPLPFTRPRWVGAIDEFEHRRSLSRAPIRLYGWRPRKSRSPVCRGVGSRGRTTGIRPRSRPIKYRSARNSTSDGTRTGAGSGAVVPA